MEQEEETYFLFILYLEKKDEGKYNNREKEKLKNHDIYIIVFRKHRITEKNVFFY